MAGAGRHTEPHPHNPAQYTVSSTDCCQGHPASCFSPVAFNCEGRLFLAFLPSLAGSNQRHQFLSNSFISLQGLEFSGKNLRKDRTKQDLLMFLI